jgi:hypothetical protein
MVREGARILTAREFQDLGAVPPEAEWFANLDNPRTKRAYQIDIREFMQFVGVGKPEEFRVVTRAHVIAWRKDLERRVLSGASIRRKLAALSSLFEHLCEANAVTHNPVKGVKRLKIESYEGKTPAIADGQASTFLSLPSRGSGIEPSSRRSSTMHCGARNSVHSGSKTSMRDLGKAGDAARTRGVCPLRLLS